MGWGGGRGGAGGRGRGGANARQGCGRSNSSGVKYSVEEPVLGVGGVGVGLMAEGC